MKKAILGALYEHVVYPLNFFDKQRRKRFYGAIRMALIPFGLLVLLSFCGLNEEKSVLTIVLLLCIVACIRAVRRSSV